MSFDYTKIPSFGELRDIGEFYEAVVEIAPPGVTLVEVGCFHGRSLIHLALRAREANKRLKVIGVDWGVDMGDGAALKRNLKLAGLDRFVDVRLEESTKAAQDFRDRSCFLVFLDAAHTPHEAVEADVRAWYSKLTSDGVLAGHDYRWHTVCEPVNAILPLVYHSTEWDDLWVAPGGQRLAKNPDIKKPTTIPKDIFDIKAIDYLKARKPK